MLIACSFLVSYDCVSFNVYLETLLVSHSDIERDTVWLMADSADLIFQHAKSRLYQAKKDRNKTAIANPSEDAMQKFVRYHDIILETSPKWKVLQEILEEIDEEIERNSPGITYLLSIKVYLSFIFCHFL
jgi:DNA excision repair protein ERCC-4